MSTNDEEYFEIVDDSDQVVGLASRRRCHGDPTLIHRVAHVLVFNHRGELLLQKRSASKDVQPGKWDTSVGGHLDPGEDYLTAAVRELHEELGLANLPLTFLYTSRIRNAYEAENVATYLTYHDGPFSFAAAEIDEVRFWSPALIESTLGHGIFTPNFEEEWALWRDWERRYPRRDGSTLALCSGDTIPDLIASLSATLPE